MSIVLSLDSVVIASPDQVSAELGGEAVILNLIDSVYYGLDPVGARVWEEIATVRRIEDVRDTLLREYDVEADRCESDLLAFVGQLVERGLARIVDEPDTNA